jgi:hypothetical protein
MSLIALIDNDYIHFFKKTEYVSEIKKVFLCFYYDKMSSKWLNDRRFSLFNANNNSNTFCSILEIFQKQDFLHVGNEKKDILSLIDNLFDEVISVFPDFDELKLLFLPSVSDVVKEKLSKFFDSKFAQKIEYSDFFQPVFNSFLIRQNIPDSDNLSGIFIDKKNLYLQNVSIRSNKIILNDGKILKNQIFNADFYALSMQIVGAIQRLYKLKLTEEQINDNFVYVYEKILNANVKLNDKDYLVFSTNLLGSFKRYTVRIDIQHIEMTKKLYYSQLKEKLNSFLTSDVDFVITSDIGDALMLEFFRKNLKVKSFLTLTEIFEDIDKEIETADDADKTMLVENKLTNAVDIVRLEDLEIGQQIKLNNFDARPGKGESMQFVEYLGSGKFVVLDSTRSLRTGDILESKDNKWTIGKKLIFDVHRNGKLYGRFQMRETQTIEILDKKK